MVRAPRNRAAVCVVTLLMVVPARAQMPPTRVVVQQAKLMQAAPTITLVGTVEPSRRSRVGSEFSGVVVDMPVRQGDFVAAGGALCRLDDQTLSQRVAEAQAQLEQRIARHDELLAGTRIEEIDRTRAVLEEAAAEQERWKFEMERVSALYEGRDSASKEVYDTRASFRGAENRLAAAQALHDLAVAGPRKEVIAHAAFQVAEQRAVLERLETERRKRSITAPFDGYVVARHVELGEWVQEGAAVVDMVELSSVLVRVQVPETALPFMEVGALVRVRVDALQEAFEGRIKHILREANRASRTFPVEIELDNPEHELAGGMFARATVPAGPQQEVLAVPKDAIVQRDGLDFVAVVVPGAKGPEGILTNVVVGADLGEWIAISAGNVSPDTRVITRGTESMAPFPMPVQIVDERGVPVEAALGAGPDGSAPEPRPAEGAARGGA